MVTGQVPLFFYLNLCLWHLQVFSPFPHSPSALFLAVYCQYLLSPTSFNRYCFRNGVEYTMGSATGALWLPAFAGTGSGPAPRLCLVLQPLWELNQKRVVSDAQTYLWPLRSPSMFCGHCPRAELEHKTNRLDQNLRKSGLLSETH